MRFWLLLLTGLSLGFSTQAQKKIAITVDDLPGVTHYYRTPEGKSLMIKKLVGHFTIYQVPAIGFVVSQWLYRDSVPNPNELNLLKQWLDAGLELGNHTFAHKDYNQISFEEYAADVVGGEQLTKPLAEQYGKPFRFFRHPFLRKGNTAAKKDSLEQFLVRRGYREAPVTVDNYDFLFSQAYDNARLRGDTALAAQVGKEYLAYMMAYVAYYEQQAQTFFGRAIPQILLTHANTINADYYGQLLAALRSRGYTFVSLEEAVSDDVYRSADRFVSKAGISWIHRWALTQGKKGAVFAGEPEVPAMITKLAEEPK